MKHQIRHQAAPGDRVGSAIQFLFENRRALTPVATAAAGAAGGALASRKGRRLRGAVIGGAVGGAGGVAYQNRDWIKGIIVNALQRLRGGKGSDTEAATAAGKADTTARMQGLEQEVRDRDTAAGKADTTARMRGMEQEVTDRAAKEAADAAAKQSLEDWYQFVKQQNEGKADTTARMQGMEQEFNARAAAEREAGAQAALDSLPAKLGKGPGDVSPLDRALAQGANTPNLYRLFADPAVSKYRDITRGADEAVTGFGIMAGEAADALTNAARTGVKTGADGLVGASEIAGKLARASRPSVLVGTAGNKVINPVLAAILNAYKYPTKEAKLHATMTNRRVKPEDLPSWSEGWRRYVLSPGPALVDDAIEAAVK